MRNAAGQDARHVRATAQIALEGVRHGKPSEQIVEQLRHAGLPEAMAGRLVAYAKEVEILSQAATVAKEGVSRGQSPRQIVDAIRGMGVDDLVAAGIEDRARRQRRQSLVRSGTILLATGLLWLAAAVYLLMRHGPQEMRMGFYSFGVGFPLVWLGCRRRDRAASTGHQEEDPRS